MAGYDGKIRVGLELNTEQFKSGANEIKSEYEYLRKSFSDIANELKKTGDMSAFKKSAESLTKSFIAVNMAMSDLIEKARASSKISVLDISTSLKSIDALKGKVGSAIANIEKSDIELNVGLDTDLTSDIKKIYSILRHAMDGISLDVDIIPKLDKIKVFNELKSTGDIDLDTANYYEQLLELNSAIEHFYTNLTCVGSKINAFNGNKLDLVEIFGGEDNAKKALDVLATASSMVDIVSERFKEMDLVPIIDNDYIKRTSSNLNELLGVYKMYLKAVEKAGISIGKDTEAALYQFSKSVFQVPSKESLERIKANSTQANSTQANPNDNKVLSDVDAEQAKSVEKINKAKQRGVDITNVLTQDEIALSRAAERNLEIEQEINKEREKAAKESSKQPKVEKFNDKVDKVVASSVIDLPKEESKIQRLNRIAKEVKVDFANEAELSQVKSKFDELKRLASEIKIETTYNNNLSTISNQLGTVKKAAEGIRFNFANTGDIEQANKGVEALKNKINELKAQRDKLNDAYEKGIISEIEFRADTVDIDKTIAELESNTIEIEADIKSSNKSGLSSLTSQVGSIKNLASEIGSKFKLVIGVVKGTISVYKTLGKVSQFFTESLKVTVSRMKAVDTAIKDTVVSFTKLTKGAFDFMHDITSVIPVAKDLKESLNNIGFGDLVGADLLADVIREATNALKEFGESSLDEGSNFQAAYLRIKDTFGDARDEIYNFAKTSKDSLGMSESKYLEAAGKIGVFARSYISDTEELAKVTNALAVSIADLSAQTGFSIDDTMEKVLSGLRGNTEAIEELGINVKVADMQNWLDAQGINASFENLNSNMQNLYRTWYMLDKVATSGAMGYAAKMMNTFSGQVRILQANLSDLKTTIGTYLMQALVPVLQIVNIVLSRLIDLANMIGKVFGLKDKYSLADSIGSVDTSGFSDIYDKGKEAISGAVDEQNKLTDATNKTTSATNKAAAAAKKALAPFHKLNILSSNKDSGSGAGSGAGSGSGLGAGVNPGVGLGSVLKVDTSEADNVVDAWLKALKEAIANGEWYAVGLLFAKKANEAVSHIKSLLEKVQPYLEKWAKNIADILNGFVSGFNWDNLGSTVATAINTITSALLAFTKNVNWDKIGEGVSKFFKGLLRDTDWTAVGQLWTEKTRIFIEMLSGFVSDMSEIDPKSGLTGWEELGTSLAELVSGMINNIPWETLGSTIAGALNGISDTVIKFTEEFNAGEEVSKIVKGINKALDEFDARKFSTAASGVINEVLEALKTAVKETDWSTLGTKVGEAIFGTLGKINWDDAAETVEGALDAVLNFADSFVASLVKNQDKIKEGVTKVFNKIVSWLSDKKNQETIISVVNGFVDALLNIFADQDWSGLYDALGEILEGINWTDLVYLIKLPDVIAESLKSTSAVSIVKGAFKFLFQGIADDISGIVQSITDKFDELNTGLVTTWDNIKTSVSTKWEEIKTSIGTSVDNIKTSVSTKFEEIKTNLSKAWDNIKTSASTKWNGIKTSISGVVSDLKTDIESKWTTLKTNTLNVFGGIKNGVVNLFTNISTAIRNPINSIISLVESMVNKIISGVNGAIDTLNKFNIDVPDDVPVIGGKKFGFNISKLSSISIPRLANGAVIKPNQRFLAELGDQTRGINIETPLDTMLDAFRGALNDYNGTGDIIIPIYVNDELNSEEIIRRQDIARYRSNGK